MIQLNVLRGSSAGEKSAADQFPFTVGRDPKNSLALSDAGVFDQHFEIQFTPEGFSVAPQRDAVVTLNGDRTAGAILKNGDVIGAGLAQVQFCLGTLPQRGLRAREAFTWMLIAAVAAAQVYLFWRLLNLARS